MTQDPKKLDLSKLSNGELASFMEHKIQDLQTRVSEYETDILSSKSDEMQLMRGVCIEMVKTLDVYKLKRCVDFMWGIGETPEMTQLHMNASALVEYKALITKRIWGLLFLVISTSAGLLLGLDINVILLLIREGLKYIFG